MRLALWSFASVTGLAGALCAACGEAPEPGGAEASKLAALEPLDGPLLIGPRLDEMRAWGVERPSDHLAFFRGSIQLQEAWRPGQPLPALAADSSLVTVSRKDGTSVRALLAPSVPLEDGGVLVQSAALIAGEAVLYCLVLDLGTEGWRPRAIGLLRSGTGWVDDLRGTVTLDDDACLPGSVPLVWGFAQSPDHTPEIALEIALECPGRTPIRFEQTILVDPCQESRLVRDFLSRFPRAPRPAKKSVGDDPILLAPDDAGP